MKLFGTSGIRRAVDKNLIQLALKVGLAVGKVYDSAVRLIKGCLRIGERGQGEKGLYEGKWGRVG